MWLVAVYDNAVVVLAKDWTVVIDVQQSDVYCGLALDAAAVRSIYGGQLRCADLEVQ